MFKLEKKKKKILILLSLNKENLSTKLSAILAPYNIKNNEFFKKFIFELKKLYVIWIGKDLDIFLSENTTIITNIELIVPVEIFINFSGSYELNIKLPNWGFLFSYSLRLKQKVFYLYYYKSLLIKNFFITCNTDFNLIINYYFLIRCSFQNNFNLIL